jgi:penicillin-binding protein 1C
MITMTTTTQKKHFKQKNKKKIVFQAGVIFLMVCFILGLSLFVYVIKDLPMPEKFSEGIVFQSTKIYDREGKIILYEIAGDEKRTLVRLNEIPDFLKNLVVVTEDKSFFEHRGIDIKAIFRAIFYDLKFQKSAQGASTLTQQLIRSYFLTREKTFERKTKEIILSMEIERRHSKEQILEWYFNLIPFGSNIYGAEEASKAFFGKHISDISLPEGAILTATIKSPSYLSPYGPHKNELLERKNYILDRMAALKYLTQDEVALAKKETIIFQPNISSIKAPHFVFYVKNYLEEKYGKDFLIEKGLKVYTTLDYKIQETAEKILEEELEKMKIYGVHNGGLVALNPKTGETLAMVGSKNYFGESYPKNCNPGQNCKFDPEVNVVTALRQPGSAFKPFVYALAFLEGYTPQTLLWDVKTEFTLTCSPNANQEIGLYNTKCYHPKNYDGKFVGPINLKSALAQSRNLPSVKLLYLVGVNKVLNFIEDFGITTLKKNGDYGLSLVLGGGGVKLLEMTEAYSVFANDGIKSPLKFITKIEDANGNIIEETKTSQIKVVPSWVAREINDILSDNEARAPIFGPNSALYLKEYNSAAKTGTTQNYKDGWIIGYTPSLVTGIWVGNNDNSSFAEKPAAVLAGIIWKNFMENTLKNIPKENFIPAQKRTTGNAILDGGSHGEHSILYYLNQNDPQYSYWEKGVNNFLAGKALE